MKWVLICALILVAGCSAATRVGMRFLYRQARLPESQIIRDIRYTPESSLDLFRPTGTGWPTMIFVFGGGWTEGDKGLKVGGKDVYGNIGRFYAARGIGVAVINYRLIPTATWEEQVSDVAAAVAWVHQNIQEQGGDRNRIYLAGHSAGAHLSSMVALNPSWLAAHALSPTNISGVIAVSGAALDLTDDRTFALGAKLDYYEERFARAKDSDPDWRQRVSPTTYVRPGAPPFLILYAGGEKKSMQRQSQRLHEMLKGVGAQSRLIEVPGQSHARMVLTLSRPDKTSAPEILEFLRARR